MTQRSTRKLLINLVGYIYFNVVYRFYSPCHVQHHQYSLFVDSFVIAPTTNSRHNLLEPWKIQRISISSFSINSKNAILKSSPTDNDSSEKPIEEGDDDDDVESTAETHTLEYSDFGDFIVGEATTIKSPSIPVEYNELETIQDSIEENVNTNNLDLIQLSKLVSKSFQQEVTRDNRIAKNWRMGNWKVRGFSLDKYIYNDSSLSTNATDSATLSSSSSPPIDTTTISIKTSNRIKRNQEERGKDPPPTFISKIVLEHPTLDGDDDHYDQDIIVVGRTDGSIVLVQLGTDDLTRFVSVVDNESDSEGGPLFQRDTSMIPSSIQDEDSILRRNRTITEKNAMVKEPRKPFQILASIQAHPMYDSISALLLLEDIIYSAGGKSGIIKVWKLVDEEREMTMTTESLKTIDRYKIIPFQSLSNAHSEKIIALLPISFHNKTPLEEDSTTTRDYNLLLSASEDGSIALWDMVTWNLLSCHNIRTIHGYDDDPALIINCVDVFENVIALGLSNGQVMVLDSDALIKTGNKGSPFPQSLCCFPSISSSSSTSVATTTSGKSKSIQDLQDSGITAISFVGYGSLQSSNTPPTSSYTLVTGDSSGMIKQWELLTRNRMPSTNDTASNGKKMEYWPRLSTQRLKKRAHIFKSSHVGSVTALSTTTASSRVISAGKDGSVIIFNPSTGEELYRMDGFTHDIRSLCLNREILVTDGMEEYIAIHDFDITDDEIEATFEM